MKSQTLIFALSKKKKQQQQAYRVLIRANLRNVGLRS